MNPDTYLVDATDTRYDNNPALWWSAEDFQADIRCEGWTVAEARRALLGQCSDDTQRDQILAGSFEVFDLS